MYFFIFSVFIIDVSNCTTPERNYSALHHVFPPHHLCSLVIKSFSSQIRDWDEGTFPFFAVFCWVFSIYLAQPVVPHFLDAWALQLAQRKGWEILGRAKQFYTFWQNPDLDGLRVAMKPHLTHIWSCNPVVRDSPSCYWFPELSERCYSFPLLYRKTRQLSSKACHTWVHQAPEMKGVKVVCGIRQPTSAIVVSTIAFASAGKKAAWETASMVILEVETKENQDSWSNS